MAPTSEQTAAAAFHRWKCRGSGHGRDREDWLAAEKDLTFGLNYRWTVRHPLKAPAAPTAESSIGRKCRFCERSAPAASFGAAPRAIPPVFGETTLVSSDDCDDCRAHHDAALAPAFEAFARPLLGPEPVLSTASIPVPALKALVRIGLAILPESELQHFDDAVDWVTNPDDARDSALLAGLGCHVYLTAAPVPGPFASLARRCDDEAPFPYTLLFLGSGRVVFQTHLPFCPRDEDLDPTDAPTGPELSMSTGPDHVPSRVVFLPVAAQEARRRSGVAARVGG